MRSNESREAPATLVLIDGSPRRGGNTDILLEEVSAGFSQRGGRTKIIYLRDRAIRYCTGCFSCLKQLERPCRQQDPMDEIYEEILHANALVWGTPVYFWGPSAQTKTFLDRMFPFGDWQRTSWAQPFRGVPFGIVLVYAEDDPLNSGADLTFRQMKVVVESIGGKVVRLVHGSANKAGEVRARPSVLQAARAAGVHLYECCPRGQVR